MNWYIEVLKKYTVFSGRAQRAEYWYFTLFSALVSIALILIDSVVGPLTYGGVGLLHALYVLAVLLPTIAVTVRRLHDTARSGWWVLISFVPLVGMIVLLVFMIMDSEPGENIYGPNPKGIA